MDGLSDRVRLGSSSSINNSSLGGRTSPRRSRFFRFQRRDPLGQSFCNSCSRSSSRLERNRLGARWIGFCPSSEQHGGDRLAPLHGLFQNHLCLLHVLLLLGLVHVPVEQAHAEQELLDLGNGSKLEALPPVVELVVPIGIIGSRRFTAEALAGRLGPSPGPFHAFSQGLGDLARPDQRAAGRGTNGGSCGFGSSLYLLVLGCWSRRCYCDWLGAPGRNCLGLWNDLCLCGFIPCS
mmetsp:Transcript_1470/g.3794  ORF Transcript_1470/g.3794 Transcript_1470/m.3794 type:complete len:236 (+) Transcript_1470:513-1220(+)